MYKNARFTTEDKVISLLFDLGKYDRHVAQKRAQISQIKSRTSFEGLDEDLLSKYLVYHSYISATSPQPYTSVMETLLDLGADISYDSGLVLYVSLMFSSHNSFIPQFLIDKGINLDMDIQRFYCKSSFGYDMKAIFREECDHLNPRNGWSYSGVVDTFACISDIVIWAHTKKPPLLKLFLERGVVKNIRRLIGTLVSNNDHIELKAVLRGGFGDLSYNPYGLESNILVYALDLRYELVCKVLIDFNIDVEPTMGLFMRAADRNYPEVIEYLIRRYNKTLMFTHEELSYLVINGRADTLRVLLEYGLDPNAMSGAMLTEAWENSKYQIIMVLLEYNVGTTISFNFCMETAWNMQNPNSIVALVEKGADPNANGGRPLKNAISHGSYLVVKTLIDLGADLDKDLNLDNLEFDWWINEEDVVKIKKVLRRALRELD